MGQYHKVVNLDRAEYLDPHAFGDGLKLMEFGGSANGTLSALAALLVVNANYRGPWAGTRVTVTGDYGDEGRFVPPELAKYNLYSLASGYIEDNEDDEDDGAEAETDEATPAEEKPARAVVPQYLSLKEECEQALATLGEPLEFHKFGHSGIAVFDDSIPAFDQLEDLLVALEVSPGENLVEVLGAVMRVLRCSRYANPLSWIEVTQADLTLDEATGRISALTVKFFNSRFDKNFAHHFARTLSFPASLADVKDFLMVTSPTR